jgi:HSP20 family protein
MSDSKKVVVSEGKDKPAKKEIKSVSEHTIPVKRYLPTTDIVETEGELLLSLDIPGVKRDRIQVRLEKNILEIDGEIDSGFYSDFKPLYTEYNIGHFKRSFELSNQIDKSNIRAKVENGVLSLVLPKVPDEQPRLIEVR